MCSSSRMLHVLVVFISFSVAQSTSPFAIHAVLALVIVELFVAFLVGISCIIFSYRMVQQLQKQDPYRRQSGRDRMGLQQSSSQSHSLTFETSSEYDVELGETGFVPAMQSFFHYIRLC